MSNWKDLIREMAEYKNWTPNGITTSKYFYLRDEYNLHEEELTIAEADELMDNLNTIEKKIFTELAPDIGVRDIVRDVFNVKEGLKENKNG